MAINFTAQVEDEILVVRASGFDESLAQVQEYGLGIISAAAQSGTARVLCDELELDYRLQTMDIFKAAEFIAKHAPKVARAAVVCRTEFGSDAKFWENVAVNRGLQVKVFHSLEGATTWLKGPSGCGSSAALEESLSTPVAP